MHNNTWVSFVPNMIIMKIEYTIPGKTSLLEFALFVKFVVSRKQRQIGLFSLFLVVQSAPKVLPQVAKHCIESSKFCDRASLNIFFSFIWIFNIQYPVCL